MVNSCDTLIITPITSDLSSPYVLHSGEPYCEVTIAEDKDVIYLKPFVLGERVAVDPSFSVLTRHQVFEWRVKFKS